MTKLKCKIVWPEELKGETQTVTIESSVWDLTLTDFMENLVKPLLLAVGYCEKNIDNYFGGNEDDIKDE